MTPFPSPILTDSQRAAVAKLGCCLARPGGIALLCGPSGSGTTTVLGRVAADLASRGLTAALQSADRWQSAAAHALPDVLLVDDAHFATTDELAAMVSRCLAREPAAGLVLAGGGRLLSLVARDARIEAGISMRVVLRPCSVAESRRLIETRVPRFTDERLVTMLHEIAAGLPAAMLKLADLAAVLAASRPDGVVTAADVETIHRRLSLQAA